MICPILESSPSLILGLGFAQIVIGSAVNHNTMRIAGALSVGTGMSLFALGGFTLTPTVSPLLNIAGTLNLNNSVLVLPPFAPGATKVFTLIHASGSILDTFAGLMQGALVTDASNNHYELSYANGNLTLTIQGANGRGQGH